MISSPDWFACVRLLLTPLLCVGVAVAQCTTTWLPAGGIPGPNGVVRASATWDPDGSGPAPAVVVLGGEFTVAGDALAARIVAYDPMARTWSGLGAGMDAGVEALAVLPNGDLVAGGSFTIAGGVSANRIARFDGTSWQAMGAGLDDQVHALAVMPNGDVVAGGRFRTAGGVAASRIARWDGVTWTPLGAGISAPSLSYYVAATLVDGNGDLVVAGSFAAAGGLPVDNIARWNGATWSAVGAGVGSFARLDAVHALALQSNGDVVAGGTFLTAGGVPAARVARFDGSSWSAIGAGVAAKVLSLVALPGGDLLAGGEQHLLRFDGTSWTNVGRGNGVVRTIAQLPNSDLLVGGHFPAGPGLVPAHAQRFDGASWGPLSNGLDNEVKALAVMPNGDLVVGGSFTDAGGLGANHIARFDGSQWSSLGAGFNGGVRALAVLPDGTLVAGGWFTRADGAPASRVARWNGTAWSPMGGGFNGQVWALLVTPTGELFAAGAFTMASGIPANRIARWNGATWSPLGAGLSGTFPILLGTALCSDANGDVIVAGTFSAAGGNNANGIARWDGATWSPLGSGLPNVEALATMPNGDLVAGGAFSQATGSAGNCIARWNGSSWSPLGSGTDNTVFAIQPLPDGQLIATGLFQSAGGVAARGVARYDGASWSPFGAGLGAVAGGFGTSLVRMPNGDVAVGGNFTDAGDQASAYVARLSPTCAATVDDLGAGCSGVGSNNLLTATSLPWIGTRYTAEATGMTPNAIAIVVLGLGTAALPLPTVLPRGQAGCSLLVTPDLLDLYLTRSGSIEVSFAIPNTIVLAAQIVHEQVVPVELNARGAIVASTSSNALRLTIGSF